MAKQKVIVRVTMKDAKKRTKALKIAVGLHGVTSVEVKDDMITVVGDGIDSVMLTLMLRKQMGFAELFRVAPFDEKKEIEKEEKSKEAANKSLQVWANQGNCPPYVCSPYPFSYPIHDTYSNQSCNIM